MSYARRPSYGAQGLMQGDMVLKVELAQVKVELDNKVVSYKALQRNYEALSAALQERQRELEEVRRYLGLREDELEALEERLAAAERRERERGAAADPRVEPLEREVEALQLRASVAEAKSRALADKAEGLQARLADASGRYGELQRSAQRVEASERQSRGQAAEFEARMARVREEANLHASQNRACQDQIRALDQRLLGARRELEGARREGKEVTQELVFERSRHRTTEERLGERDAALRALKAQLAAANAKTALLESQLQTAGREAELGAAAASQAKQEKGQLLLQLKDRAQRLLVSEQDKARLQAQLNNAENRYRALLDESAERGGAASALADELQEAKARLASREKDVGSLRKKFELKLHALRAEVAAAVGERGQLQQQLAEAKWERVRATQGTLQGLERVWDAHKGVVARLAERVEGLEAQAEALGGGPSRADGARPPASGAQLQSQVAALEGELAESHRRTEGCLEALARRLAHFRASAAPDRDRDGGAEAETAGLQDQVAGLLADLAASREALARQQRENGDLQAAVDASAGEREVAGRAAAEKHAAELAAQKSAADAKLRALEGSVRELEACSRKDRAMAHGLLAKEQRLAGEAQARLGALEAAALKVRSEVGLVAMDLEAAAAHLRKMKVAGAAPPAQKAPALGKAGSLEDLAALVPQVRTQLAAYVATAQDVAAKLKGAQQRAGIQAGSRNAPNVTPEAASEVKKLVAQVIHIEESLGTALHCMECLDVYVNPVTCVPCGHKFCGRCVTKGAACPDCEAPVADVLPDDNLDAMASKHELKLSALKAAGAKIVSIG